MKKHNYFYRNGLTIVFISLFLITLHAQALTGWKELNQEREDEHAASISFGSYLNSGHFVSATFENFQSEFLQMALYVVLTISLRQKGSAESKKLDEEEEVDREPRAGNKAPWPVKKRRMDTPIIQPFTFTLLLSSVLYQLGTASDGQLERTQCRTTDPS